MRCTVRYKPTVTEIRWWLEVRPPSAATRCGFYTGISNNTFTTHAGQGTVPVLATAPVCTPHPRGGGLEQTLEMRLGVLTKAEKGLPPTSWS